MPQLSNLLNGTLYQMNITVDAESNPEIFEILEYMYYNAPFTYRPREIIDVWQLNVLWHTGAHPAEMIVDCNALGLYSDGRGEALAERLSTRPMYLLFDRINPVRGDAPSKYRFNYHAGDRWRIRQMTMSGKTAKARIEKLTEFISKCLQEEREA